MSLGRFKSCRMVSPWNCLLLILLVTSFLCHNVFGQYLSYRSSALRDGPGARDEGSCICGLNSEILDKLESIIQTSISLSTPSACTKSDNDDLADEPGRDGPQAEFDSREPDRLTESSGDASSLVEVTHESHLAQESPVPNSSSGPTGGGLSNTNSFAGSLPSVSSSTHFNIATTSSTSIPSNWGSSLHVSNPQMGVAVDSVATIISKLSTEIERLQAQLLGGARQPDGSPSLSLSIATDNMPSKVTETAETSSNEGGGSVSTATQTIINSGFLSGLPTPSLANITGGVDANNEALMKLNQSVKLDAHSMQSALQSTIPGVVSNIFSSIQNFSILSQHDQHRAEEPAVGTLLTSIDGSSVEVQGDSNDEQVVTSEGEKLLSLWIDHQLDSLHLTASTAAYIRRSALGLFRQIARQYIARVGGSIEVSAVRATQMALNNTQNLIAFLLRHYLYFSGGLMQIIGEQVSRVGKRMDSTGESIAHLSLNPFDIVSNVIESLPNPSDYSNYFRAFGKRLIGEFTPAEVSSGHQQQQQSDETTNRQVGANPESASVSQQEDNSRELGQKTLLTRTMGALTKTFGSWVG